MNRCFTLSEILSAALTAPTDSGLLPEDGEKILPAQAFSVALETPGDRLRVALEVADGDCRELVLHLRSGEGAVS